MFKVSTHQQQHDSPTCFRRVYSLAKCSHDIAVASLLHEGCAQRQLPMQASKFDDLSQLNQMAIHFALSKQYNESMECFDTALSRLCDFGLSLADVPSIDSMKQPNRFASIEDDYFDERIEYDEGWCLCNSSSFPISIEVLGAGAPWQELTATLLYNVGQVQLSQRRYRNARELFINAYGLARSVTTKNSHLLIVPLLHRIGYLQYWHREITEAIESYQTALQYCQGFPAQPLKTAATLNCLGVLHFHLPMPDPEKSREYLLLALSLQTKTLGTEDCAVATTLNNLGRVYFTSESLDLALEAYEKALAIRRRLLGNEHVDVAATVYNCGQTLQRMGKLNQALDSYKEFVRISLMLRRPNRYIVIALKCMAVVYQEQLNPELALKCYKHAVTMGREILGDHAEIAALYNKLGNLLYQMGNSDAAIQMYERGLAVERVVLHPHHPNIAVTLCNLAQIHKQRGDFRVSLQLYEEALTLQSATLDQPDAVSAVTLSNIGLIYYQTKRFGLALEKFQEALRIRREILGEDNLDVASCLNSLGLVLFKLGLADLALQRFTESLRIRRDIQGESHRDVATILHNIATIHLELGDDEEGVRCYKESLRIERKALGPLHDDILSTLECLGKVHQFRGELTESLDCFREVLEIRERKRPIDEGSIAQTLNLVANLSLQLGDVAGAIDAMSNAVRIARNSDCMSDDEFVLFGFELYGFAKLHPEAAAVA